MNWVPPERANNEVGLEYLKWYISLRQENPLKRWYSLHEKVKAMASDFKVFNVNNCKAFMTGDMSERWYSTTEVALSILKFDYNYSVLGFQIGNQYSRIR